MILVSTFGGFAHGIRHGIGFANAQANVAIIITSHNRYTELKAAAAFYHFGNTGDFDHALIELLFQSVDNSIIP